MHRETHPVRSRKARLFLVRRFFEEHGKPPSAQAIQDALGVVEAKALFEGEQREVYVRVAEHEGAIYVDLANDRWEVVEIDERGWRVVSDPPVRFKRPKGMLELPHPTKGGDVSNLRHFVNIGGEKDWRLLAAWLVQAFRPTGPYPILILQGEQGSAKTTTARILRAIADPSTAPVRTVPRNEHDLAITASNSWVVALDNLSGLPAWLSDALCRLSTGGGFSTRTLYENDEETLFDSTRPVILNGISDVATRPDLLDRAIILTLPTIPEEDRRPEDEFRRGFEEALPSILGGLFDAVSCALGELPNTELPSLPRMADFGKWATAAEEGLGMSGGQFLEAYAGSRKEINEFALESDPVAVAVIKLIANKAEWIGTATELWKALSALTDDEIRRTKAWPKAPNVLSGRLKRLAPGLRRVGIEVADIPREGGTGERKKRLYKITPEKNHHDGRGEEKASDGVVSEESARDGGVTVPPEREPRDRHGENPIEMPNLASCDDRDGCDDEMQPFSKGEVVTTEEDLQATIAEIEAAEKVVALDLETTGLDPRKDRIRLLSLATTDGTWLIDCFAIDPKPILNTLTEKTLLVHKAMHDLLFLRQLGYRHRGRLVDTMTLSRMVHAGERDENGKRLEHSLEACCARELGIELDKTHQKANWAGPLSEEMVAYAANDARVLLPLYETLEKRLRESGQGRVQEIEEPALLAGIEMAYNGVHIAKEAWLGIIGETERELETLYAPLDDLVGEPPEEVREKNAKNKNVPKERKEKWNWNSDPQIKQAAASVGLTLKKTSKDYLKLVDHELAGALLAYKEVKSGLGTYGEKFFEPTEDGREVYIDGRLYPSWKMCEADTGRMSCAEPNMQSIPSKGRLSKLRECVLAPKGRRLIKADYSQIELRIAAKVVGEKAMLEAYNKGEDLHAITAKSITGKEEITKEDRTLAKAVNFGLLYGQGSTGLRNYARDKYGVEMSLEEAAKYRERFFETYPAIRVWHRLEGIGFDIGEDSASTLIGRMRRVGGFTEKVNHPVQGTGADGLKLAMAFFHERMPDHLDAKLVIACHDELVVECPEEQAEEVARFLEEVMVAGMDEIVNRGSSASDPDRVPVEVEIKILESWGEDN